MLRWPVKRSPDAIYSFSSGWAWLPRPTPSTQRLVTTGGFPDAIVQEEVQLWLLPRKNPAKGSSSQYGRPCLVPVSRRNGWGEEDCQSCINDDAVRVRGTK